MSYMQKEFKQLVNSAKSRRIPYGAPDLLPHAATAL